MVTRLVYLTKNYHVNPLLQRLLKPAVSVLLLALVFNKIPLPSIKDIIAQSHWPELLVAFALINACMLVSAIKWRLLLKALHIEVSLARLVSYYYAGLFANNFLPSSIGGDALRIYDTARLSGQAGDAAASVVMERLLASLALGLTALAALVLVSGPGGQTLMAWCVGGLVAVCLAALLFLFWYPFNSDGRIGRWLCRLKKYREHAGSLVMVMALSFLFQGTMVLANVFIFRAIGVNIPLIQHFLYIPVIMAVSMVPLSINGLGVRQGMYVLLYGWSGLDAAAALAGALVFFVQVSLTSLAGGIIIALRK